VSKPKECKIFVWSKVSVERKQVAFSESFLELYSIDTPVQELWNGFKTKCHDCLDLVPSFSTSKSNKNLGQTVILNA